VGFGYWKILKPRMGRQKTGTIFFRLIRGFVHFLTLTHGCTVGYYRPLLRS
jgi:hypothetical protein